MPDIDVRVIDWLIVAAYFAFVIWLGSRFGKRQTSSKRYFLGNRNLPGWAVGMSIFATIISSWTFMSIPGKSFKVDMQYMMTIATIPISVIIAIRFIIPVFRKRIKISAYEYLERRFSLPARFYGNIIFIMGHCFKMGTVLFLLCLAVNGATNLDDKYLVYVIFLIGLVTIIYTFFGGIEGVVWTDVIQGFLLLAGGIVGLAFILFSSKAGPVEIVTTAYEADKFKLAEFSFSWTNESVYMLLCMGFMHYLAKYTTDQTVIQRYLLAPSSKQAARSLWISITLLGIVWLVFMVIGAVLWSYYEIQPELLPDSVRKDPDQVFSYFIGHQLPVGVSGITLAGIFAAAMSTLSSDLNSLASVVMDDFYSKIAVNSTDRQRLVFSRLTVIGAGFMAIFLAVLLRSFTSMVNVFFTFNSILGGTGIVGVFFLGIFTRRCHARGLYMGIAIAVAFVGWAVLTHPLIWLKFPGLAALLGSAQWLPRYTISLLWLGLFGNLIAFTVGYCASLILNPNYRADESLTIYSVKDADDAKEDSRLD